MDLIQRIHNRSDITAADLDACLIDDPVDPADPRYATTPTSRGEKMLHKLNGVTVTRVVEGRGAQTHYSYEIEWRGEFAASASMAAAVDKMRLRFPKPAQRHSGEILAFRVWGIAGDCLIPITRDECFFDSPIMTADHPPGMDDSFGLHSVKMTPKHLQRVLIDYRPLAYGFVGIFGTVVEHEDGYRSSKQVVRRIILRFPASAAFCKCLADRYECEVIIEKRFRR